MKKEIIKEIRLGMAAKPIKYLHPCGECNTDLAIIMAKISPTGKNIHTRLRTHALSLEGVISAARELALGTAIPMPKPLRALRIIKQA
jgi:hypothetical protein